MFCNFRQNVVKMSSREKSYGLGSQSMLMSVSFASAGLKNSERKKNIPLRNVDRPDLVARSLLQGIKVLIRNLTHVLKLNPTLFKGIHYEISALCSPSFSLYF